MAFTMLVTLAPRTVRYWLFGVDLQPRACSCTDWRDPPCDLMIRGGLCDLATGGGVLPSYRVGAWMTSMVALQRQWALALGASDSMHAALGLALVLGYRTAGRW